MIDKDFKYRLAHLSDTVFKMFDKLTKILLLSFNTVIRKWQKFYSITNLSGRWKRARILTFPFHFIWIWIFKNINKNQLEPDLINDTEGLQIIGGNTGSGKSTLGFDVMEYDRIYKGRAWYVNTRIEKPSYNEHFSAYVRYHRYIEFTDVWSNFKTNIRLNNYIYNGYLIDEIHRIFDYRQNSTNAYASVFVPFRDYAVVVRKHIKRLIGITQMDRLDIQLMYLVKYWHKPRIDIGFDYEDWMLETGLFRFKVKGWYIDTFTVDVSNTANMLVPLQSWYRKATANFDNFDTYAFNDVYDHIKLDTPEREY